MMNDKAVERKLSSLRKRADRIMDRLREFEMETQVSMENIQSMLNGIQTIIEVSEKEEE